MDDARARAAIQRIAAVLNISIEDLYRAPGDRHPDEDEAVRVLRAFLRLKDARVRRRFLDELEAAGDEREP